MATWSRKAAVDEREAPGPEYRSGNALAALRAHAAAAGAAPGLGAWLNLESGELSGSDGEKAAADAMVALLSDLMHLSAATATDFGGLLGAAHQVYVREVVLAS
jgi:hypothetical protein